MKLNRKILLVTISVLFVSLLISSIVNIANFRKNYTEALITGSFGLAQSLNSILEEMLNLGLPLESLAGMDKKVKQLVEKNPHISYAAICDLSGRPLFHSDPSLVGKTFVDAVMKKSISVTEPLTQLYQRFDGHEYYDVTLPIYDPGKVRVGIIRLGFRTEVVSDKVWTAIIQVAINFTLSFLLIAFLINILLSRLVSRPVIALSEQARKIADGQFDMVIPLSGDDEISILSGSLHEMAGTLKLQIAALNHSHDNLEKQIQLRTAELEGTVALKNELVSREKIRSHILEKLATGSSLPALLKSLVLGVEQGNPHMLCSIMLLDYEGKHLCKGVAPSLPDFYNAALDGIESGLGLFACGAAALAAKRILVAELGTDPCWIPYQHLVNRAGLSTCWSHPIRSSAGPVLGTFAIYHQNLLSPAEADIALIEQSANLASIAIECKRAELEAAALIHRNQVLMDNALEGIHILDKQGNLMEANHSFCRLLGYTWEEVRHFNVADWDAKMKPAELEEALRQLLDGQAVFETLHRRKDGSVIDVETSAVGVELDGHKCVYASSKNITERKLAEAELLRSNSELEQFSYAISHDMRQPLRMITSHLQLLKMSLLGQLDDNNLESFSFAIDGAKRMDGMMLGLLEYSRIGLKGEPPAWIESRSVLEEALRFLHPAITEAQALLRIEGDWPRVLVSPDEILRLLQNLIGNAVKFRIAGRTPEVTISSKTEGAEWRISVTDNGVGILPNQIDRLFQVFQCLQSRSSYEGTGIGLALCRKIAEHHGGKIWAESQGEGLGSCFLLNIPLPTVE